MLGRLVGGGHLVELQRYDYQQFVQSLLLLSLIGLQGLLGSVQIGCHNFYLKKASVHIYPSKVVNKGTVDTGCALGDHDSEPESKLQPRNAYYFLPARLECIFPPESSLSPRIIKAL